MWQLLKNNIFTLNFKQIIYYLVVWVSCENTLNFKNENSCSNSYIKFYLQSCLWGIGDRSNQERMSQKKDTHMKTNASVMNIGGIYTCNSMSPVMLNLIVRKFLSHVIVSATHSPLSSWERTPNFICEISTYSKMYWKYNFRWLIVAELQHLYQKVMLLSGKPLGAVLGAGIANAECK